MTALQYILAGVILVVVTTLINQYIERRREKRNEAKEKKKIATEDYGQLIKGFQENFAKDNEKLRKEVLAQKEEIETKYDAVLVELEAVKRELITTQEALAQTEDERNELQGRVKRLETENASQHKEIVKLQSIINMLKKNKTTAKKG